MTPWTPRRPLSSKSSEGELERLRQVRLEIVEAMDADLKKLYEGVSRDGKQAAVTELDEDACGHCYAIVPIQQRNRVLGGDPNQRCEACGMILTAPDRAG